MNNKQFFYVHGLNSSKDSKKFKQIKEQYPNSICLDWKNGDNLHNKIYEWCDLIRFVNIKNDIILISSSTGCNLNIRMLRILEKFKIQPKTILLNPLFNVDQLYDINIMPIEVSKYLGEDLCKECLVIYSSNDEVVDHEMLVNEILDKNSVWVSYMDNHNLKYLPSFFEKIDEYIESIYI